MSPQPPLRQKSAAQGLAPAGMLSHASMATISAVTAQLETIQARVASTIGAYEAADAAPDAWTLDATEIGLGEAIDPREALRVRSEIIMRSLGEVAEERTATLSELHSTTEGRRKELADADRAERRAAERRAAAGAGAEEAPPAEAVRPEAFYERLGDVEDQHGRLRSRGSAFLTASLRMHRKVAEMIAAANRCVSAEERAAELEAALGELGAERDALSAQLEESQAVLSNAKAELRTRGKPTPPAKKKAVEPPKEAAAAEDHYPLPPPAPKREDTASAEGLAAGGTAFAHLVGEWLSVGRATMPHASFVANAIAAHFEATAATAAAETQALLAEAAGEEPPAWQSARDQAARARARGWLAARRGSSVSTAEANQAKAEARTVEAVLRAEVGLLEAALLTQAVARGAELRARVAQMETALEAASSAGAAHAAKLAEGKLGADPSPNRNPVQAQATLDAIGAAMGTSGGSVADKIVSLRDELAAAALRLEEAKAEARREQAAIIVCYSREMGCVEAVFAAFRDVAYERERLLKLGLERASLEVQILADETDEAERRADEGARAVAKALADARGGTAGADVRALRLQAAHEARLRTQRLSLLRAHAERLEAKTRQAEAEACEAAARLAAAREETEALRQAETRAQQDLAVVLVEATALEGELAEARAEADTLRAEERTPGAWEEEALACDAEHSTEKRRSTRPGSATLARAAIGQSDSRPGSGAAPAAPSGLPGSAASRPALARGESWLLEGVPEAAASQPSTPRGQLPSSQAAAACASATDAGGDSRVSSSSASLCSSRPCSAHPSSRAGGATLLLDGASAGALTSQGNGWWRCTSSADAPPPTEGWGGVCRPASRPASACGPPAPAPAKELPDHYDDDDLSIAAVFGRVGGALQKSYSPAQLAAARGAAGQLDPEPRSRWGHLARDDGGRVAYLLREAVGHSSGMGIHTAVRPALLAAEPEEVRGVLARLFVRQRQLASQRALDNWELLALAARLRPRQELLHSISRALEERRAELGAEGTTAGRELHESIELRLARVPSLLARNQRRFGFASEVHALRRSVFAKLGARLLGRTLHALTRLTNAVNVEPALPRKAARCFEPLDETDELARLVFARAGEGGWGMGGCGGAPLSAALTRSFAACGSASATWEAAHLAALEARATPHARPNTPSTRLQTPAPLHPPHLAPPASARHSSPPRDASPAAASGDSREGPRARARSVSGRPATAHGYPLNPVGGCAKGPGAPPGTAGGSSRARMGSTLGVEPQPEISVRTVRRGEAPAGVGTLSGGALSPRAAFAYGPPTAASPRRGVTDAVVVSAAIRSDAIRIRRGPGQLLMPALQ